MLCLFCFAEFTEAAKVHSNDDGISRHGFAPFNAYYLTYSQLFTSVSDSSATETYFFKVSTVLQLTHWVGREFQEFITLLLKTNFLTSSLNLLLNSLLSCFHVQEALLPPRDRATRCVSRHVVNCCTTVGTSCRADSQQIKVNRIKALRVLLTSICSGGIFQVQMKGQGCTG